MSPVEALHTTWEFLLEKLKGKLEFNEAFIPSKQFLEDTRDGGTCQTITKGGCYKNPGCKKLSLITYPDC